MIKESRGAFFHIIFDDGKYKCPHCRCVYTDGIKRESMMMKNKRGYTARKCLRCFTRFGIASNPRSGIIAFDLSEAI